MSTGEMLRMLFAPYRRKVPESEETEEAEDGKSEAGKSHDDRSSQHDGSATDRSQGSTKTATTERDYKENIDVQRSWFNLVCYGLPNLIVTQI